MTVESESLKRTVALHWEKEPCGTRGLDGTKSAQFFREIERERYSFEPHIEAFAAFKHSASSRVLEIGVGAGTDYVSWLRHGAYAYGIDLTAAAIELTARRCEVEGVAGRLSRADCEDLPFRDDSFDIVYSYGVIHHSPDTQRAVREIHRVLKPGGSARVMIYHAPSITGFLLWGVHCLLKGRPWRSPRWAIANYLESAGTKAYTVAEARHLFADYVSVRMTPALGTGDLLLMRPSDRYRNRLASMVWELYPRGMIRKIGSRLGLCLLVEATK